MDDYQLVELPLSGFVLSQDPNPRPLTQPELNEPLDTFVVGQQVPPGTQVWVDDVEIGW
jgi:hypothetical protein